MNLGEAINKIKDKADYIDLVVLYENPETYYNEIVEIIHIIKNIEEPTRINFQSKYNVLDPTAEGAAFQQIAFSLEATLAQKQAELSTLAGIMSATAPEIVSLKRQIKALEQQITEQKTKINDTQGSDAKLSINQLMAQYSNLQVQVELALQAYGSSLMTLENARVDTYQQLQHLVTVESPTLPDDATYPKVIYNLVLLGVLLSMAFIAIRIVVATIREL